MRIDSGTRALVTGSSRGIGRALARSLAGRGAVVGLMARSADELRALSVELGGEHVVLPCDVADRDAVFEAVSGFAPDLVVVNAGIAHFAPVHALEIETAERLTAVNWLGTVYVVKAALPHLLSRAEGHFLVVNSVAGWRSFPWAAVYGGTKAAQRAFSEALWHELSGSGVGLTLAYLGEVATSLHEHDADRKPDWYRGGPDALDPAAVAEALVRAVEDERRAVWLPPALRIAAAAHAISPRLADGLLRMARGGGAAPRRG